MQKPGKHKKVWEEFWTGLKTDAWGEIMKIMWTDSKDLNHLGDEQTEIAGRGSAE